MTKIKASLSASQLIAPCGINCRVCRAYDREKNACPGCRGDDVLKAKSCVVCHIKNCEKLVDGNLRYCFECGDFPCARLVHLDKRYRTKYGTSVIDNLRNIKTNGIRKFIETENQKWTCPKCGSMMSMHKPECPSCGYLWNRILPQS